MHTPSTESGRVTVITHETATTLGSLVDALEACNLPVAVVRPAAASAVSVSVAYLRPSIREDMTGLAEGFHELRSLEATADRVVNSPSSLQIAHHLLLTGRALMKAGVRHAPMESLFEPQSARDVAAAVGFPMVLRPAYAAGGRYAVAVRDHAELAQALEEIVALGWFGMSGLVVQQFVRNAADVSVLVVDGCVVATTQVLTEPDPARGNIGAAFGTCPTIVSATAEALAEAAVRAVGGDIMAAHLLFATDGTVVVADVNGTPDLTLYEEEPGAMSAIACAIARRHGREGDRSADDRQRVPLVR